MIRDPNAALAFPGAIIGGKPGRPLGMGASGSHRPFAPDGAEIGGIAGGGSPVHGPPAVPDAAFIVIARDPQGAHFARVGPKWPDHRSALGLWHSGCYVACQSEG